MDYGRPALADRLAAEYALGTLRGAARRRFEGLLTAHPLLRAAVAEWTQRLMMLGASIVPVQPPASVWTRIELRLFPDTRPIRPPPPWWRQLALWRTATGLATAAAVAFAVVLLRPSPSLPPVVVVLAPNPQAGARPASFVASVSADGGALVLRPLGPIPVDAARALELWAVPAAGSPRSLGLISASASTTVMRTDLLAGTAAFAVSVEPRGGSPTGAPSGPIVSLGKLQS